MQFHPQSNISAHFYNNTLFLNCFWESQNHRMDQTGRELWVGPSSLPQHAHPKAHGTGLHWMVLEYFQ